MHIIEEFYSKTDKEQVSILLGALEYMGQSNTRTKWECISSALGHTLVEDGED